MQLEKTKKAREKIVKTKNDSLDLFRPGGNADDDEDDKQAGGEQDGGCVMEQIKSCSLLRISLPISIYR